MRELTYYVATSIDGYIAAPDGDWSAFLTEGDHFDMIFRDYPETLPAVALEALGLTADGGRFGTVLMGWGTYDVGLRQGVADPYPHLEQVVFTRRHAEADVPSGVRLVTTDPVAEVQRLKQADGGGLWLCGGGRLAGAIWDEIDRLVLKVNPIVLGDGIPLVRGAVDTSAFALDVATPYTSGVVVSEYRRRERPGSA